MPPKPAPPDSKADKDYWNGSWSGRKTHAAILSPATWRNDFVIGCFDRFIREKGYLSGRSGSRILELGCANSLWLPYFASKWSFRVEGLDYSETGAGLAREVLRREGVAGTVHLGDIFEPPAELAGRFDIVYSLGVLEHFEDRRRCVASFRAFLSNPGLLITVIPNLSGLMGRFTRLFTPDVYARHVPTSPEDLRRAQEDEGMRVLHCDYFLPIYLGVLNLDFIRSPRFHYIVANGCAWSSKVICSVLNRLPFRTTSRLFSPYILSIAETTSPG